MTSPANDRPSAPSVSTPSVSPPSRLPLTSAQRGIWYAQKLDPENPTLQIGQYLDLQGEIDPGLMGLAFGAMVRDVDSLSLRFHADHDGPYALIERSATADVLAVEDLRGADRQTAADQAREQMDAELRRPRDLEGDDLIGGVLFRLPGNRSLLFQRVHHIMLDGYSAVLVLQHLARVYDHLVEAIGAGVAREELQDALREAPTPFPSYLDLIEQRASYDSSPQHAEDEAFWRARFEEETPVDGLEGTTDRLARQVVRVSVPLVGTHGVPLLSPGRNLPQTVMGVIAIYLAKITGQQRVSLGLPVTGRRGRVARSIPSMLSSILPIGLAVSPGATVAETIADTGQMLRDALKHQQFPVQELSSAPPQTGPTVNLLPVIDALQFGPATGQVHILSTGPVQDLSIVVSGLEGSAATPTLQLEGDASLYSEESLAEHAGRLVGLLDQVADQSDQVQVADISVVHPHETSALLKQGSGPDLPLEHETVLESFSAVAASRPDDIAVVAVDGTTTFAELQADSTRLAHHLRSKGVNTGRCVAVRIERSRYLPLLVLAVLKAGGVYVPLDPEYPIDRVGGMIEDADPVLLLTSRAQAERDRSDGAVWTVPSLAVDSDTASPWRRSSTEITGLPTSVGTDLAYVVFTSGSTGRPKGVGVERVALRNLFQHHRSELFDPASQRLGRPLKVAHTAGLSFDAAWDPLLWLFAGHQLHVVEEDVRRDPQRLVSYLRDAGIDSIETTPSFAEALMSAGLFDHGQHPVEVALGGEAVGPGLWAALSAVDDVNAVNFYGPTETTVDSLIAPITGDLEPHIGTSVRNSRHYILDAALSPVPEHAVGELHLAGVNVARGYVGQPGLTAERFVADPFAGDGSRMYRTGDVVRRRRDGSLRFLGRIDDQVKIRGYRVELSEIEAALRRQPGVASAAALVQDEPPVRRLIGYVTSDTELTDPQLGAHLRQALREELPEYMVPSTIMTLAEIPLTTNGKLDRRALPVPRAVGTDLAQLPRSGQESLVAGVFAEVLGLETIGVDEDFFAAGGHSLLATRVAAQLSGLLDRSVTVRDVFEATTVAALAERVSDPDTSRRPPPLVRAATRPDPLPVSLAQRRLWFLNRLEPSSSAYNIPIVLDLGGQLDEEALRAAFADVVQRHEPLRTVFPYLDGEPVQQLLPAVSESVRFTVIDCPLERAPAVVAEESLRPFDVTRQTPVRGLLLRTGEDLHVLVVTLHHIASDGWSLAPFARDLSAAYAAHRGGGPPDWEPLPVSYADFTVWQRQHLGSAEDEGSVVSEQLRFWRRELTGAPDELPLPRDRPRGAVRTVQGGSAVTDDSAEQGYAEVALELDPERHAAIRALAARHRSSVFMVLHAALAVALAKQGAGDDIVIGTPVAGRTEPQLDQLVGFFVNTLVLRTSLAQDPTLAEVLDRVRAGNTEAYGHQDVPFDAVVDAIGPPRVADRHPLFQVLLTLQSTERAELDMAGLQVSVPSQVTSAGVKTDLLVDFQTPRGDDGPLVGALGYDRALFDAATADGLRAALELVLEGFVQAPGRHLSQVEVVAPETRALLQQQATGPTSALSGTVLDRLTRTVADHPESPAVVDAQGTLTFTQLEQSIVRVARVLARDGIRPGDRVVIALPRNARALVLVLAVLRAGAIAVPTDISYPDARIAQILADCEPALIVIDDPIRASALVDLLPGADQDAPRVCNSTMDSTMDWTRLTPEALRGDIDGELPPAPTPSEVAYLVYTSGTTGTPKGVQVPHSALTNVLAQHEETLIGPLQRRLAPALPSMLHLSGLGFDAAWDPLLWLVAGTTIEVADDLVRQDAEAVVGVVAEHGINVVETTPSYAQQLIASGLAEATSDRTVPLLIAVGGEAVSAALWDRLVEASGIVAWNLYGPSEFTVDSVVTPILPGRPHIGAPVVNVTARVLDRTLAPVPPGVAGELYLSGLSEAHGYRGRPAETALRFVADPQGNGTRMYRTGDIVRRRHSGELEFLRRDDDQVKLRGYRIEMADVERAVERADGVRSAVVRTITPAGPDTTRLVAWMVGTAEEQVVRRAVAAELPDYMVPSSITSIAAMPLTPNGKVDVGALPAPVQGRGSAEADTDDERAVCAVMAEVLGVAEVGLDDDFFARGGHSLLAVGLINRLREELGAGLPLRAVFEASTPREMLGLLRGKDDVTGAELTTLRDWTVANPRREGELLPLSAGQARLRFLNRLDPQSPEYNVVLGLRLAGELDREALSAALDDLLERHQILRTTYPDVDGQPVQQIQPTPSGVLRVGSVDPGEGFDLAGELPLRAGLEPQGEGVWHLDLVIHHIATDGASLAPLVRDLSTAYCARMGASRLQAPLEVQYSDFARREQSFGAAADAEALGRWTERLAGAPTELALPTTGPRPQTTAQPAGMLTFEVPAEISERITALAAERSASSFHAWLAGLGGYLSRIGAGDDIVIGSPSAGRTDPDVADLVGFFVNTLPLRIRLADSEPSLAEAIDLARTATLDALEDESVSFERIVEAIVPERRLGRHPLFQTMLSVEEPTGLSLDLPGVRTTPLAQETTGSAKVDLSFTLRPRPASAAAVDGVLEYNAALFSTAAAEQLVQHWIEFLRGSTQAPDAPMRDTEITNDVPARLPSWPASGPRPLLVDAFTASVLELPDHTAVVAGEQSLDFRALQARVDHLAGAMADRGVSSGDVVALRLPRSIDTVAALLATWRAGGVALPIDTSLPTGRVSRMLRTSSARLVLHADGTDAEDALENASEAGIAVDRVVSIDALLGARPSGELPDKPGPEDPAYLVFTSGTTGEPKGVQVPHRALASLLASHRTTVLADQSRPWVKMAHTTGTGFDAAMDPIVWLAAGHQVHVVDDATRRDPQALAAYLRREQITAWETTPSYVNALIAQTELTDFFDSRPPQAPFTLLLGGEAIDPGLWSWLRERPTVQAWNLYGPTEVGVDSLVARVTDASAPALGATTTDTIGYVLDSRLRPVVPGSIGELWLAGAQLAHGYAGRAAATAERFVADPFAADGSRMYRTGDLTVVREAPEDRHPRVICLGRSDGQVKIRGYRVEPDEIEASLRASADVAQAVVRAVDADLGKTLSAWIVPTDQFRGGADALVTSLQAGLRARVPDYMMPSSMTVIDSVPLTPNGKVDADALPRPRISGAGRRPPRTAAERAVATAFADTLGVTGVSAEDSFFALGGHSFVAQPTIAALNAALNCELPVQALFRAPTVAALAELAVRGTSDVAAGLRPVLPLRGNGVGEPLFVVHSALGLCWEYSILVRRLNTQRPILGLQARGIAPDEPEPELASSLDQLVGEYVATVREAQPVGPYHFLGFSAGGQLAQHIAARLQEEGEAVSQLTILDAYPATGAIPNGATGGAAMWTALLQANGVTDVPADAELDLDQVMELLAQVDSPLATLPAEVINRIQRRFERATELLLASPTPALEGNLQLFEAGEEIPADRPSPQAWQRHVTGRVSVSRVGVRHADMLSERALDMIAPVVSELLRKSAD